MICSASRKHPGVDCSVISFGADCNMTVILSGRAITSPTPELNIIKSFPINEFICISLNQIRQDQKENHVQYTKYHDNPQNHPTVFVIVFVKH